MRYRIIYTNRKCHKFLIKIKAFWFTGWRSPDPAASFIGKHSFESFEEAWQAIENHKNEGKNHKVDIDC